MPTLQSTLDFDAATRARDAGMALAADNSGPAFQQAARAFALRYLEQVGEATGESITDAAKAAGIRPVNTDKSFGAVYMGLARAGLIVRRGWGRRLKGHLTGGATIWGIA